MNDYTLVVQKNSELYKRQIFTNLKKSLRFDTAAYFENISEQLKHNEQVAQVWKLFEPLRRDSGKEVSIEEAGTGVQDMWRISDKMKIFQEHKVVQDVHLFAYGDHPLKATEHTDRFMYLLSCFEDQQGGDIKMVEFANQDKWKIPEDASFAVKKELDVKQQKLCRFFYSIKQSRYTDTIVRLMLLSKYGGLANHPLKAVTESPKIGFITTFNQDKTRCDTVLIPVSITGRSASDKTEAYFTWKIQYHYDADCYLKRIQTSVQKYSTFY